MCSRSKLTLAAFGTVDAAALAFAAAEADIVSASFIRDPADVHALQDRLAALARPDLGIVCLCEAAHVPVIWATQVLETLAKNGRPTRAEVTDAAMAERAEGVMLNKGPFVAKAVLLRDDILRRMSTHQDKKSAMFRPLEVAQRFALRLQPLASAPKSAV